VDLQQKLRILSDAAKYDVSCASSGSSRTAPKGGLGATASCGVCHSYTPDGRCISLLKVLLTNYCVYDCVYCVNRVSSDIPRARFTIDEAVNLTLDFYRRNYIDGLFLSSGIIQSADYTMEQLVAVARALREAHKFGGYIHLKAIAGCSADLLRQAGLWADRLSANIELPTQADLSQLAPDKTLAQIEGAMSSIHHGHVEARAERKRSRSAPRYAPAGQSTQLVVGATPTTDRQIIHTTARLYESYELKRVYYSAFSPFPRADARLPLQPPPLVREHRLYQADWLMRFYGFAGEELTTDAEPNFSSELDPKMQWALRNRHVFPIDVNRAPRELLLRVPGLGYQSVQKLLGARRYHRITLADLERLRVPMKRLRPWVITADWNEALRTLDRLELAPLIQPSAQQLSLFDPASALSGEL
jgi:putative DNA modification/repair radical SAM protein